MANKIKSIAECGQQPTYYFEVGQKYPPDGITVTDIVHFEDDNGKHNFQIYNEDGILAEMIDCPVVIVYDQTTED